MSLQQNPVTEKPFKHVDTAGIVLLVLKINLFLTSIIYFRTAKDIWAEDSSGSGFFYGGKTISQLQNQWL